MWRAPVGEGAKRTRIGRDATPALTSNAVMARKTWILDTDTKGTGANMVPLEKVAPDAEHSTPSRRRRHVSAPRDLERQPGKRISRPLPDGHVRKKTTGEIGKLQAIDARAGTATVRWLKSGAVSTVPISAISRS